MAWFDEDNLLNALTNPGVNALMGMTQGFAQAAMPTRMPTPWGATLGMGVGGMLPAIAGGQQLRKLGTENERSKMLMDWYKSRYSGNGAPMGAPGAGGTAGGGTNPYLVPPSQLAAMGDLAMATGSDRAAATLYGMPNTMAGGPGYAMGANERAFAVPGGAADPRTIAAKTAAEAAARAPWQPPVEMTLPTGEVDKDGNPTFGKRYVPHTELPALGAPAADPFKGWTDKIIGGESNGVADARNPASTAAGAGQFLEGTWPTVLRATRPDLTAGKSDAALLPLRDHPELARAATEMYGRQNGAALAQKGIPVNGATVALAHGFGPGGAATILQARPDAPLSLLPGMAPVIKANPQLADMTAGQLVQKYTKQMGGTPAPTIGIQGAPVQSPDQDLADKLAVVREQQGGQPAFNQANTLRDEFQGLTTNFRVVQDAYENIRSAAKADDGAGDMSMLYSYVKMLDPGSVVREGEFATAAASGSFGERIQGAVARVISGARLPESLRQSFVREASNLYENQRKAHDSLADQYETLSRRFGLDPTKVVNRYTRQQEPVDAKGAAKAAPAAQTPGAAPAGGSVPPPDQRKPNATYPTPMGPMIWTGTGWVPPPAVK